MNETTTNLVNETLHGILESAASVKDFVVAETPEVVNQLLMWKLAESVVETVIGVVAMIIALAIIKRYHQPAWDMSVRYEAPAILVPYIAALLPFSIACTAINFTWLQIWIAPKLYLLEYASDLIK